MVGRVGGEPRAGRLSPPCARPLPGPPARPRPSVHDVTLEVIGPRQSHEHARQFARLADWDASSRARRKVRSYSGRDFPRAAASGTPIADQQPELPPMALAGLRQRLDQREGAAQMADGLLVRRAVRGALAGPLVGRDRLVDPRGQPACRATTSGSAAARSGNSATSTSTTRPWSCWRVRLSSD